jgi:flagellar assembly factor FliW
MPRACTKHFGSIEYEEDSVLTFPAGLPAFESRRRFILLDRPSTHPLLFLQSIEEADLCFPALPIQAVDPCYALSINSEDLELIGAPVRDGVPDPEKLACFVLVSIPHDSAPTANLLAPVVVNLATRVAVQAVRSDNLYSHQQPLGPATAPRQEDPCS